MKISNFLNKLTTQYQNRTVVFDFVRNNILFKSPICQYFPLYSMYCVLLYVTLLMVRVNLLCKL